MKKVLTIGLLLIYLVSSAFAEVGFRERPIINNLSMPTGYTLNQGEFLIGIGSIGFGITDNIQLGTNVLLFILQDYNASLKISLAKTKTFAIATGIRVDYFNLDVFVDDDEGEASFTFLSPYIVISPKLSPKTTLHIGGQYSYISGEAEIDDAEAKASSSGTRVYTGLEYSFSHKTKFLAEGGYDITFEGFSIGGGVLFGWEKFRLKLGVTYYNPKDTNGFTLPNIGLWWRFKG